MSGGRLVVLDRLGRDAKRYGLARGLATLGSGAACDIRVMLPSVCPHHATIAVHNSQTVIRNVGDGETTVNGESVSVAALRHGDVITLGDRSLRWEYSAPSKRHQVSPGVRALPVVGASGGGGGGGGARRGGSAGGGPPQRPRALQLDIEMNHRASMPASSGGKQVAIVQPQRRDTNEHTSDVAMPTQRQTPTQSQIGRVTRRPASDQQADKRSPRLSPKTVPSNTTKATLWIESRKSSPRRRTLSAPKSTPLRLAVLKKAQSAHKLRVVKIEAPLKIDHTKQAAIMLMTGHTPKSRLSLNQSNKTPSYVVKKPSPVRKTPARKSRQGGRSSKETGDGVTPKRASTYANSRRSSKRNSGKKSVSIMEITDSDSRSTMRASSAATRASKSPQKSPSFPSPKKSALKDLTKKGNRKTESIKFDLSNLENHQEAEITSRLDSEESMSEDDMTLHYSESSAHSPSPRRVINSRSSRMMEQLGTTMTISPSRTLTPNSPSTRKSARGSLMVQKALDGSDLTNYSKSDQSANVTTASAFKTRTLSPRTKNIDSYSIVDLVSIDSDTSKSIYNSADSANTTDYGTPNVSRRKTRSTINPTLLGSSTPYVAHVRATRSTSNPNVRSMSTRSSAASRRSKSLSTPENKHISVNSTRVSRASRCRSRINDSDLLLLDETELEDSSPKTSRRTRTKSNTVDNSKVNICMNSSEREGTRTPENRRSPEEIGTPILSIQSFLNSSQSSLASQNSVNKGRKFVNYKRKTIGVLSEPKRRSVNKSKSLGISTRQTVLRLSKDSSEVSDRTDEGAPQPDNDDTITPKSSVTLIQEAVKNKHSTAKKPQSKRSIIDDLNQSDIVKQLFNSPVKRKLSQSMTEFSRKQHFDDEIVIDKRPTRNTIAVSGRTIDDSISEHSGTFTPERFVSPISTPSNSPNLSGIKRLFRNTDNTPVNDLRNVRGVRSLLRTHRTRRSAKNDLTNVAGVKLVFAKSPKNRLSDVRVKEVFKSSPNNDLRRVSGVKSLFRRETSPKNDLTDVRGVKKLFRRSPNNDLRNVSGVKKTLRNSPKNDLTDVRGVRKMFRHGCEKESSHNVSGVEELFNTSNQSTHNSESLFDQWVGKPTIRSVYSKTYSTKLVQKPMNRKGIKTLHSSLDVVTNNVEEWLELELQKRFHRDEPSTSISKNISRNATKALQNLVTSTVEGGEPIRSSRTRNSSMAKKSASEIYSAHTLPIKKRSLVESSVDMGKPMLPIKKRAVVHSTPVKGTPHVTLNASELGRVSPIALLDNVHAHSPRTRTTRLQKTIFEAPKIRTSKAKTPQKTPTKPVPQKANATPNVSKIKSTSKASPKNTKGSPKVSPKKAEKTPPKRVTRNRKNTTSENNTKKRRTSLVISKKAPVMSPKADRGSLETSHASPIKRITRGKKPQKVETPPRVRVRALKATVVVTKPSPKLKPQAKEKPQAKGKEKPQTEENARRTRKNIAVQVESPKESQPRKTRGKQNEPKGKENKTDNIPAEKPKRGRRIAASEVEPQVTRRGRGKEASVQVGKSVTKADEKQPKTRGKKAETQVSGNSEPNTRRKNTNANLESKPKTRGKKAEAPVENEPKTRGKKVEPQSSVQSEPMTRGRRAKPVDNTVIPETKSRKRKSVPVEEVPSKIAKTESKRGRKAAPTVQPAENGRETDKTKTAKETNQQESKTRGRGRKLQVEEPTVTKATRGRKAVEPKESPVADKRKRKTKADASPAKGKKTTPTEAKQPRTEPAGTRRGNQRQRQESVASGRTRRR